jgi:tRNA(Ile)-lysidine synthase TilS/MesJ
MTLCTLLREHREKEGWPKKVFAYTIDHNVRAGSANEARTVRDWVIQMGIKDVIPVDHRIYSPHPQSIAGLERDAQQSRDGITK